MWYSGRSRNARPRPTGTLVSASSITASIARCAIPSETVPIAQPKYVKNGTAYCGPW